MGFAGNPGAPFSKVNLPAKRRTGIPIPANTYALCDRKSSPHGLIFC